ncbi:hypothetical protein T4A_6345 [Trichinella pseudospiralis]|uniref:Uncharacterized protein n=1 Tax=Trichinella pseudospiralis TaxID=6337 RepID=A0A0V1D1I9_TRIPS|nr:hypothetical protein T4A_6345 [Trichinella pseudospiralis]
MDYIITNSFGYSSHQHVCLNLHRCAEKRHWITSTVDQL